MRRCLDVDRCVSSVHDRCAAGIRGNAWSIVHTSQRLLPLMDVAGEDFRRTLGGFSLSSLGIAVASASALAATACFMHTVLA
jgi:hypothetical protein